LVYNIVEIPPSEIVLIPVTTLSAPQLLRVVVDQLPRGAMIQIAASV
jgi:hypothetical protein